MFTLVKKIGFEKIGFGTDILTSPAMLKQINKEFVYRTNWFTPAQVMQQATYKNSQILALSGPRNPYPGVLGMIEKGALADLLLINGNPLSNMSILTEPENIVLIMKDGKIYKNTLLQNNTLISNYSCQFNGTIGTLLCVNLLKNNPELNPGPSLQ